MYVQKSRDPYFQLVLKIALLIKPNAFYKLVGDDIFALNNLLAIIIPVTLTCQFHPGVTHSSDVFGSLILAVG